jgi:hypothetical protein
MTARLVMRRMVAGSHGPRAGRLTRRMCLVWLARALDE